MEAGEKNTVWRAGEKKITELKQQKNKIAVRRVAEKKIAECRAGERKLLCGSRNE